MFFRIVGSYLSYRFQVSTDGRKWRSLGPAVDGTLLSPAVLQGFNCTGVFVGLYASSNGSPGGQHADSDWFDYRSPAKGADEWIWRVDKRLAPDASAQRAQALKAAKK